MSDSLWPHGLQYARPPCPSPSLRVAQVAQVHDHWISDAIQPSHPLSSSLPAFSLSQHQGLFLACRLFLLRSFIQRLAIITCVLSSSPTVRVVKYRHTLFGCFTLLHLEVILFFNKMKVCGYPALSKSISVVFPTSFVHFMSPCLVLVRFQYFKVFHHYCICYGDLWSVILGVLL